MDFDIAIIGGGFYGAMSAVHLQSKGLKVALIERESRVCSRASFWNQARVHGGYHYPRSLTTAFRSQKNYELFSVDYAGAMAKVGRSYYGIASQRSLVTADQFYSFCQRIGAAVRPADTSVIQRFDPEMIAALFEVEEIAFDAAKLRDLLESRLRVAGVTVLTSNALCAAEKVSPAEFKLTLNDGSILAANKVVVCGYAATNEILEKFKVEPIAIKYQLAELALVEALPDFNSSVTIMDGPFFSYMPFPALDLFSFSHVIYTHHNTWDGQFNVDWRLEDCLRLTNGEMARTGSREQVKSNFKKMLNDAIRYWPEFKQVKYRGSFFELKALLPRSAGNDSRPIFVSRDHSDIENLHVIIGSKMDNIYDCLEYLDQVVLKSDNSMEPNIKTVSI